MQSPLSVFRPSTNDSKKLTATTQKKDWFFLSYPLSPFNIACVILEEVTNFVFLGLGQTSNFSWDEPNLVS